MRNLLIFFTLAVVGVYSVQEMVYGPKLIACCRKYNVSDDLFKPENTENVTAELMKDVNLTAVICMGGCYVKKELDFLLVPEITIENMPRILEKANMSEDLVKSIRKCDEESHQNDCEFAGCYVRSVIGYAFANALEQGIDSWIEGFKRPKA